MTNYELLKKSSDLAALSNKLYASLNRSDMKEAIRLIGLMEEIQDAIKNIGGSDANAVGVLSKTEKHGEAIARAFQFFNCRAKIKFKSMSYNSNLEIAFNLLSA